MSSAGAPVTHVAVVPSAPVLLPAMATPVDPVAGLRDCVGQAVSWLATAAGAVDVLAAPQRPDNRERGVSDPLGWRLGRALLGGAGLGGDQVGELHPGSPPSRPGLLVVANGSATRSEKAPGHLDERAFAFDDEIAAALGAGRTERLVGLDEDLAEQLWCHDASVWRALGVLPAPTGPVSVDLDEDPFGVRYWVARWTCGS